MSQNYTMKSWAEDDQPREKLRSKGKNNLSDSELLAILLGSGTREKSALDLAKEILNHVSSDLSNFAKMNFNELLKFKGIGEAKAVTILAAMELGRRRNDLEYSTKTRFTSGAQVYNFIKPRFQDLHHEEFHIILLNRANQLITMEFISSGGYSSTVVDSKMLFKRVLDKNAHSVILCHNHPSGILSPSNEDLDLTKRLLKCGTILEITILDHIIYTDNGYFSFLENGLLN